MDHSEASSDRTWRHTSGQFLQTSPARSPSPENLAAGFDTPTPVESENGFETKQSAQSGPPQPHPTGSQQAIELVDGAVCTSTRLRRQWHNQAGPAHHLIDPATGRSANSGVASVGVVAAGAAQAEVLAKVAFLAGADLGLDLLRRHAVEGVIVTDDGCVHDVGLLTRSAT